MTIKNYFSQKINHNKRRHRTIKPKEPKDVKQDLEDRDKMAQKIYGQNYNQIGLAERGYVLGKIRIAEKYGEKI